MAKADPVVTSTTSKEVPLALPVSMVAIPVAVESVFLEAHPVVIAMTEIPTPGIDLAQTRQQQNAELATLLLRMQAILAQRLSVDLSTSRPNNTREEVKLAESLGRLFSEDEARRLTEKSGDPVGNDLNDSYYSLQTAANAAATSTSAR